MHNFLKAGIGLGHGNIFAHGPAKQEAMLHYNTDLAAQMRQIDLANVMTVDPHRAELDRMHGADQPGKRRLAGAAPADNTKYRSLRYRHRDIVERRGCGVAVTE